MKNKYYNRYYIDGELEDTKIISALEDAARDYANGEIMEVRGELREIIEAIDRFIEEYKI